MTTNIYFPKYYTIGDLKEYIENLPSDGLVEFFTIADCGCCTERFFLEKRKDNFSFVNLMSVGNKYTPVLKIGQKLIADRINNR